MLTILPLVNPSLEPTAYSLPSLASSLRLQPSALTLTIDRTIICTRVLAIGWSASKIALRNKVPNENEEM